MHSEGWQMTALKNTLYRAAALSICAGFATAAMAAAPEHFVSQKDQIFTPAELDIKKGETVEIVNDDGDLLHHLYVDSKRLQFDSGDQEPGAKVDITFPATGTFDVLVRDSPQDETRRPRGVKAETPRRSRFRIGRYARRNIERGSRPG